MQGNLCYSSKKRAARPKYVSNEQLELPGFITPYQKQLDINNRWVKLAHLIPWDKIVNIYQHIFKSTEGREPINGRIIIGCLIIKHLGNISDRETVLQVQENMYLQYFLGYTSFTTEAPFTASLFVEIRKRLNAELLGKINEIISSLCLKQMFESELKAIIKCDDVNIVEKEKDTIITKKDDIDKIDKINEIEDTKINSEQGNITTDLVTTNETTHLGKLLVDATVAPQAITYPTDLKLLNASREKSEELIDKLYEQDLHGLVKPRTYRKKARKYYLNIARKKNKTKKVIYKSIGQQLRFLKRNINNIDKLLESYKQFPLDKKDLKYLMVIRVVYEQQSTLHINKVRIVEDRIVNLHQPHVRPIVRGKERNKTEFGCKLQISLVKGFVFIDKMSWDTFNEGRYLLETVKLYKKRFGFYPKEVLADKIYSSRENRQTLKDLGIKLVAKPLGRPIEKAVANHIRPGERNPIEGKFGQGKIKYGLDKINAKLANTSTSWISSIFLVLNLVNLTRVAPFCLNFNNIIKTWILIFKKIIIDYYYIYLKNTNISYNSMRLQKNTNLASYLASPN